MSNDTRIAVDVAKAVFEIAISDRPGHVAAADASRAPSSCLHGPATGRDRGDGSVRLRPPLGAQDPEARPPAWCCCRRTTSVPTFAATRRIAPTPRASWRQPQRRDPARAREDGGPAGPDVAASAALGVDDRAHGPAQCAARPATRARRLHPVGAREVVPAVWALIEDADSDLPEALRPIFAEACREIREIEARVKLVERQLAGHRGTAARGRAAADHSGSRAC